MKIVYGHVALCRTAEELKVINRKGINLAILDREIGCNIQRSLRNLKKRLQKTNAGHLYCGCSFRAPVSEKIVHELLTRSGIGVFLTRPVDGIVLTKDVTRWANIFYRISGKRDLHILLDYSLGNHYSFFHIDGISRRLLITYFGPGLDWIPNHGLDADDVEKLKAGDFAATKRHKRMIQKVETGQVAILKGMTVNCKNTQGLAHRRPLFSGSRLRLMID